MSETITQGEACAWWCDVKERPHPPPCMTGAMLQNERDLGRTIYRVPIHPDDSVPEGCVDVEKRDGSRVRFDLSGVQEAVRKSAASDEVPPLATAEQRADWGLREATERMEAEAKKGRIEPPALLLRPE